MLFLLLRRRSVKLCHSLERVAERDTKLPPYLPLLSCFCFFSYNHDASCSSVGPTSSWSLQFCFSIHFPFLLSISLSFSSTTGSKDVEWHSAKKTRCTRELSLSLSLSGELCCCENSPRVVVFVNMFGGRTSTYKLWRTTSSACFMSTMMSMPLHHLVSCRSTHVSCCLSSSYFSGNSHNLSTSSSSVLRVHLLQLCGITRLTSSSTSSATDVNPWQRRRLLETPCSTLNGKFLRGIITIVFCGFFWMPHLRIPSFLVLRETRVEDAEEFWRQAQTTRAHAYGTARARSCGKEGSGTVQWRDLYEVLASFWLQV